VVSEVVMVGMNGTVNVLVILWGIVASEIVMVENGYVVGQVLELSKEFVVLEVIGHDSILTNVLVRF
jgi:hypothetical protein